jgi:2-C-methyl-D-erythritol 2,4-cyclodiphosphate synthase
MRIGLGYDVHRLVKGRQLILGGVLIPHPLGLSGHSDADVLTHAVCDALLGAAAEGDIGIHFPDSDPQYRDISSLKLLARTCHILRSKKYEITNIDATIIAEAPRIQPHSDQMVHNLADAARVEPGCVNVKATTVEGLGSIGKGEGIAAMCVALIR